MAETTFTVKIAVQQDGSISLIDQAGQKIASLGQAASAATGGLGTLADGTQAVGTAAQSAGSQMGDAGNKAGELGSKAASSSGGISSMASTLLSLDAAVRLANAAFDLGKAAFDAFFMSIVDRAGSLDDLSQKIGVAGSTLSQLSLAAQATGTSVEGLGNGFKFLSVNINEAANGSSESAAAMRGAFQTLGVDVTAALSDTNGALLTLADTFATMPDGAEKTALAMQLFGRAGVEIIPFLNLGSEGIARMTELNDKLGLSFSGETLSALDNFGDQLTILGNVGTGVFTQLVTGAAPALSQMADALVDMAAKAGINSGTLQEWGRTIATTVVNAVASALGAIGQFLVDIESAGIGTAIYNAFATGLSAVGALASSAMASVKASIYDALSVLPLIGSSYADAAEKMRASSASYLASISAIGQGSTAIGNAGQVLIDTSDRLRGVAASASEAGGAMSSAADGSDQMSTGMATVATGANLGHEALKLLTSSGTAAGPAVKGAGDAAGAAGAAAGGAAGGVDKLSQAMEKFASQSTEIATKQGIYDAYISGAINYETALIALDTAQIGGKEATENLTVAMEAEKVAREQGAAALTKQTAELMNKNAETSAEVAALAAAAAAGQTYESAQLGITAAVIQYQAEQKLAAGYTAEQVAAWAEAQMQVANLKASVTSYTQALKDNSEAASLEKQIATWEQVRTGVMSVSAAQRQLAIDAKVAGGSTVEAATKLVDLADAAKTGAEVAANAYVNMGDIIEGAFTQSFDAVISGTRDLGDALEGIGLSIGKQMFSAMLKSKMNFDDTVQANFLGLGEFGSQTFSEMFTKAADFGAKVLGSLSFNVGSPSGGGGNSTTNPSSPDFIGPPAPPGKAGGGGLMSDFMAGIGYGQMGKMIGQTFFGEAKSGSEGVDRAISGLTMVTSGLANTIPLVGPLLSALTGLIGSQLPRLFAFMVGVTTKGTGQRREGESILDKSSTFSALQKKDKLGDFTRGTNDTRGLEDNYRTGVATAVERGMAEGEANGLKGAGEGIFSVLFKGDGDKMVNGAMDMGRGMAEFLSRGLADGMTYDEMMASLRELARENEITFSDALIGVTKFGAGAMEQFGKIGHAEWGAQEFADSVYGISEVFANDFPAGVNLAAIALQTMEKDGSKAFANLDGGTKAWILSVANDAEAFKTVFADLAIKGFTIDTVEFENTLADITASAEFVGANIGMLLSAPTLAQGMQGIGDSLKSEITAALGDNMLGDLFDTTGIATAFQGLFSNIRQLKDGSMDSDEFMGGMAEAIASGKANLEEYLPRIKAMREAFAEVKAAVDEAFKPTREEQTEIENKTVNDSLGSSAGAALSSVLSGGDVASAVAAFSAGFQSSISQSVMEGLQSALIQAATTEGALGGMMASFKEQTAAAMADGVLTGQEQADLSAMAGQIKDTAAATASALEPIVGAVAAVGASLVDSTAQASAQLAEMQGKVQSAFSGAVGAAFSAIGEGKSVADAQAAFAESFKKSIASSVAEGLQEALVNSAVMEGALGGLMSQFKDATAAAMSDGVITASEQANLAAMAGQIKTAGDAAAAALAPVVGAVAAITAGTTSAAGDVSFNVASQAQGYATAADTAIGTAATSASTTVATASTSAATTISTALEGAGQAMATGTTSSGAAYAGAVGAAATSASGAIAGASTEAGATISGAIAMTGALLAGTATELTGAATDSAATTTAGYADAAKLASDALGLAGQALSGDVAAASESLKVALTSVLGAGDTISALAPDAAYGIGQSLADVRDKVAPEMQTQIDALIGSLSDASLTPEESAKLQAMVGSLGSLGSSLTPEMASQTTAMLEAVGSMGGALDPEAAAKTKEALGSLSLLGGSVDPGAMAAVGGALAGLGAIGTSIDPEAAARTADALSSIAVIGTAVDPAAMDALGGALAGIGTIGTSLSPELAAQAAAALGSVGALGESLDPATVAALGGALTGIGTIGTSLSPELAAQTAAALGSVGALGESIDPAMMEATQSALSSLATIGSDIDPAMMDAVGGVLSGLSDAAAGMPDPAAVVETMQALGDAALSSGQASDLAGTMRALGSAALDAGQAADMSATLQAFAASSSEGASNTTAVIEAFGGIDAGMSGSIKSSLESLVSSGVAEGATALSESLGGDGPAAIVSGLSTLQSQLDSGTLSSLTTPLTEALSSVVSPADELQSALQSLYDPTRNVTSGMSDLGSAVASAVDTINGAISGLATAGGVPAAATGGQFASGSAVVGEAGKPELVTASQGGGFSVTPLSWDQAHSLMGAGTAGFASGGRVGMGRGGADLPVAPPGTGGGGGNNPGPRYTPNAEGAEFADFTSAITDAFRAGLEGSKGFIEDFSDTINESVRTQLVDAIMQGFSEGPAIQKYADAIDVLITKAQTLAGNGELTAASLGDIQAQIKANTDAIGEQADQLDEILEPLRQASAISTAFSEGLDFSGALKSLAADPSDLEAFGKSIDQTVNDAVLNGAIQGLLASGPIQDAVKKFGDSMNDAMATALEDGVITAEESDALHDMAVSGSAEMKTAMEALGPVLSALGIDLGDAMTEGINRATEVMKSASSAMDPFAALGEGETQFTNFTQNIKDQVYSNIKDGLVQAFIDSAVTNGLLAGPMMAIQAIFDQIGQKQLTTAEANAALAEQTAAINGSLNDPAFKSAFDTTMASISSIGQGLGQTSQKVESAASTAANSAQAVTDASKDVCSGKCELEKQTMQLGNAAVNTFGRAASVSIEEMLPKLALGGLVTKKTMAVIGEAGPELVIPTKELAAAASAIQRVDFGSARESATAGMASLMAAMPTSLADSLSGAMTDQQDAMAQKIKQAASAGGGTAGSISDALASAMESLTGGGDIGAIAEQLSGAMTDQNTALAEKIKQSMSAGGDVSGSISDALVGAMGSVTGAPAAAQAAEKMKATMAGTGGSLTDIADTLSGLSTSLTATATTTSAAMAQRLAEVASATVEKPVVPTQAVDIERVVAGTMSTVDAIKDLEDRLDKLSDAILAQPTEVIVQMDRETLMRAMAKADRFKKKARYGVQA